MRGRQKELLYSFLLGLGSQTKIYFLGVISFSELALYVLAPYLLFSKSSLFKRVGAQTALSLCGLLFAGAWICAWANDVYFVYWFKDCAIYYSMLSSLVVFVVLLSRNPMCVGYYAIGALISSLITIFAFNPQVAYDSSSGFGYMTQLSVEETMSGVMFWFSKVNQVVRLPIYLAYLKLPILYPLVALPGAAVFTILSSASGRSAAAGVLMAWVLIFLGRKSARRIHGIGRHFLLFAGLGLISLVAIKNLYSYTAAHGFLGDEAQKKYEMQTRGDSSFMSILMSGRTEFFIGIRSCFDAPLVGQGPRAIDRKGYMSEYIYKHGTQEEILRYQQRLAINGAEYIPHHSCLTYFWARAGIAGLFFWLYVFYLIITYFSQYACAIPQVYGYFSISLPPMCFMILFNPYTDRIGPMVIVAGLLTVRAVWKGRIGLPMEMIMEAKKHE